MRNTFLELENDSPALLFKCIAGSRAYGTNNENSDTDMRGIFAKKFSEYLSISEPIDYCANETNDIVYFSLKRFVQLASKANPNILELLFSPKDCVLKTTPYFEILKEHRQNFISKHIVKTHINYAKAQIKKARGKNKHVYNPQPKTPPTMLDFCFFIDTKFKNGIKIRPKPLTKCIGNIDNLACSKLEHSQGVYRLYNCKNSGGIFSDSQILCKEISIEDEEKYIGLMLFNENAYKFALQKHKQYWQWRNNRNEQRWNSQENGESDYDSKNMMHLFRILFSAKNILENCEPLIRCSGKTLAFLLDVRASKYEYDELIKMADNLIAELFTLVEKSKLPNVIDLNFCDTLIHKITSEWELNL